MKRFEETLHEKQVVILGGSSGIGLETARLAHAQGAKLVLVGRDEQKLKGALRALGGATRMAIFDVADEGAVRAFFEKSGEIDHILLAAGGPFYAPLAQMNFTEARRFFDSHIWPTMYPGLDRWPCHRDAHGELRPGACPHSGQHHCLRVRRHSLNSGSAWRGFASTSRRTGTDTAYSSRGASRGRGQTCCALDAEHRNHRVNPCY